MHSSGFESLYAETSLGKVHYYQHSSSGRHAPLVFIHGLGGNAAEFSPLLWRVKRHSQTLISLDLPSHGLSECPAAGISNAYLNQMIFEALDLILRDLPPAILCGNSLGGMAAVRYCQYAPQNVKGLFLTSPGGGPITEEDVQELRYRFIHEIQASPERFIQRIYRSQPLLTPLIEKELKTRFSQKKIQAIVHELLPEHCFSHDEIKRIEVPGWVIWGKQERILDNHVHFWKKARPEHWHLKEPLDFTHCPHLEDSHRLARQLRSFSRSIHS